MSNIVPQSHLKDFKYATPKMNKTPYLGVLGDSEVQCDIKLLKIQILAVFSRIYGYYA